MLWSKFETFHSSCPMTAFIKYKVHLSPTTVQEQESSRTQILNANHPSNHPSTTKTRPQVKQARLPTKTAVVLGPSY